MTAKNPIRRFARCKMFGIARGCNHFKWIDDTLCDRVRSVVVEPMMQNETLGNKIGKLQKLREERKAKKESVKGLKETNRSLKL